MNLWLNSIENMEQSQAKGSADGFPRPLQPDDEFYRAIHPDYLKKNGKISPGAFSKATANKRMSVDWAENSTASQTYERWERWGECRGVASITAGLCWENNQSISFAQTVDNPSHSEVASKDGNDVSEARISKKLARGAKLRVLGIKAV